MVEVLKEDPRAAGLQNQKRRQEEGRNKNSLSCRYGDLEDILYFL